MKLVATSVATVNGREIVEFSGMGPKRFKVLQGRVVQGKTYKTYVGKTSDGGYTSLSAAKRRAAQ